ncbi:BMP family ABC transporter substrate-binding protein [Kaustia mangrovi]|uniref:BMP family ABC transporter substrate-binding protein n=1 Tax=Kaustia mangrovi TaxID=2593653 RepID=A0A7S8HDB3_9HYPH|nr:BMP family ABC transporter substrate-binding protein [Kaustia mangrovi]
MNRLVAAFALAVLAVMAGPSAPAGAAEDPLKVGFVYVGPIGDHGWTYQHDQGRKALKAEFGDKVETAYVENVSEGADAERVIRELAASGNDLIFTTSFGFMNPTVKVARQFPDKKFEHATGYKRADNVATYAARFYEGRAVIGTIAGRMTKSNVIGYIGAVPIPEVVRGINAFTIALRKVNPDATVRVVWVNSWYDPGKEAEAAKVLIDQGADILVQHTDSTAPLQAAEKAGIYGFGQASDMAAFAPKAQLTAIVDDWSGYYIDRARAVMDGTWASTDTWGGLASGMVKLAPYNEEAMPADVVAEARAVEEAIKSGERDPFAGPVRDQSGTVRIAEGETASDKELLGMNWYVEGVEGKLPN